MAALEHDMQAALFEWLKIKELQDVRYKSIFAIPNAGLRSPAAAAYYKAEGLKAGVPDLFVAVKEKKYAGLFIEMKRPGEVPNENQSDWLDRLTRNGYLCAVCRSTKAAMELIEDYLR